MDWNSRRTTAIIENALLEDRATRDATSYACIDVNQRAAATIIAKQDCVLAGIGCIARILDVYASLDGAVTSHYEVTTHPSIFDGVRLHKGQSVAVVQHNAPGGIQGSHAIGRKDRTCEDEGTKFERHAGDRRAIGGLNLI